MRQLSWLALLLALALLCVPAMAGAEEGTGVLPEAWAVEGQTVMLTGTLFLQDYGGNSVYTLELDVPVNLHLTKADGTVVDAIPDSYELRPQSDLSSAVGGHVAVMGEILAGNEADSYRPVVLQNAAATVSDGYLTIAPGPAAEVAANTPYQVQVIGVTSARRAPSVNSDVMSPVNSGEIYTYLYQSTADDRGVTWHRVQLASGESGWLPSTYATLAPVVVETPTPEPTTPPSTGSSGGVVAGVSGNSNIRTGPALSYPTVGLTLHKGESATYLGQSSVDERGVTWYAISFGGKTGWVSSRYTQLNGVSAAPPAGGYDSNNSGDIGVYGGTVQYVRATGRVNVRLGPDESYESLNTMQKNEQVPYLGESYDAGGVLWYKVEYYSYGEAWVSSLYSQLVWDAPGAAGVAGTDSATVGSYVEATGGKSSVRTQPNLNGKVLGTLQKGKTAPYLGESSVDERGVRWYKVSFEGNEGWISSRYTTLY